MIRTCLLLSAATSAAAAQTEYYHTDAGRPVRVEDASTTTRGGLELHLAPFRAERIQGGAWRLRLEPKLAVGILPRTEVSVRVPFARIVDPRDSRGGLAGIGFGVLHAIATETSSLPAVALGAEVVAPIGPLASPRTAFSLRGNATSTGRAGRLHFNGSVGSFSVAMPPPAPPCSPPDSILCIDRSKLPVTIIPDVPCLRAEGATLAAACTIAVDSHVVAMTENGWRWLVGIGFDRALPFQSLLIGVDVVAEQLVGLFDLIDYTAEAGIRMQATPWIVLDAGLGWRFAGMSRALTGTIGATYSFGLR